MDDQAFIRHLWNTGHFWNPDYPDVRNIEQADLPALRLTDGAVRFAVASYQLSDANFTPLVQAHHGRAPLFDGRTGPATLELATLPRCPMPDFAPPPGASFDYGDPDLNRAVASMQAATGSGSWPAGCYDVDGVHEVKISYDLSRLTNQHREWWPEIQERSHAAMADVGVRMIEVAVGERANITVYGKVLGGSIIGMAEFNGGSCGDVCFCQLNPNYAPDLEMVLNLLLHENGHNWNLEHRAGNIMNPTILRRPTYWAKRVNGQIVEQDNSYPTLKRFFGGEPLDPTDPPGPPVAEQSIRLARSLPAGVHGDFTLGSSMPAGDYVLNVPGDGPPVPVP